MIPRFFFRSPSENVYASVRRGSVATTRVISDAENNEITTRYDNFDYRSVMSSTKYKILQEQAVQ